MPFTVSKTSKKKQHKIKCKISKNSQKLEPILIYFEHFIVEFKLNITNCAKVRVFSEAFADTTFHGHFENILDLDFLERAFSRSSARITITNSKLDEVRRLDASLKEIKFSNSRIGTIQTNAFDVIKIDSIIFEKCTIDTIQNNAFTEKVRKFSHFIFIR